MNRLCQLPIAALSDWITLWSTAIWNANARRIGGRLSSSIAVSAHWYSTRDLGVISTGHPIRRTVRHSMNAIPRQMRRDPFRYPVAALAAIVGQGSIIPHAVIPECPLGNLASATDPRWGCIEMPLGGRPHPNPPPVGEGMIGVAVGVGACWGGAFIHPSTSSG